MKKFYSLLLSTLLLAVGGVEVEAQTELVYSWDFTSMENYDNISGADGKYGSPATNATHPLYGLSFAGNVKVSDGTLIVGAQPSTPSTDVSTIVSGVRIPAPKGYIVKVTGYTFKTSDFFTWNAAELLSTDADKFPDSNDKVSIPLSTVVGISVEGESSSKETNEYVTIENERISPRHLYITKIKVYKPNNGFKFEMPTTNSGDNYQIYDNGYLIRGNSSNYTPLDVTLNGFPQQTFENTKLVPEMCTGYNDAGSGGVGNKLTSGQTVYGDANVLKDNYADITMADILRIQGDPGLTLRVLFNRITDDDQDFIELTPTIGAEGYVDVNLTSYDYVHLNVIKIGWGQTGTVTGLILNPKPEEDPPLYSVHYSCECKGAIAADIDEKTGKVSNIRSNTGNIDDIGGAIIVKASYKYRSIINNAEYVITVPYQTNIWDFVKTEPKQDLYENTASTADWGLAWKVRRYDEKDNTIMTQLSAPVLSNAVPVAGDNARFIDRTAGLIFEAGSWHFGTNTTVTPEYATQDGKDDDTAKGSQERHRVRDTYNSANNVENTTDNHEVTMQVGSRLTIPNLLPGQHIRMRWNRHQQNNGELMRAFNVTDLDGKSMTGKLFNLGSGSHSSTRGHQEFIVEADKDNPNKRVDVVFELVENTADGTIKNQQGWANIQNIRVGRPNEFLETHMKPVYVDDKLPYNSEADIITKPDPNGVFLKEIDRSDYVNYDDFKRNGIYNYIRKSGQGLIKTKLDLYAEYIDVINGSQTEMYKIVDKNVNGVDETYTGTLDKYNCFIVNKQIETFTREDGQIRDKDYQYLTIVPRHGVEEVTSTLKNPGLTNAPSGWTVENSEILKYQQSSDGHAPVVEFYQKSAGSSETFKFSQNVKLTPGYYRLDTNAFYREGDNGDGTNHDKVTLFAGEETQNIFALTSNGLSGYTDDYAPLSKAANAFDKGDFANHFYFYIDKEQDIEIGLQGVFDHKSQHSWCVIGPVKLYKYTDKGAHGSFTLALESRQIKGYNYCDDDFLLDSIHVKVNVYEYDYNVKPYPYTWAMEHFTTDTGNNTTDEIDADAKLAGNNNDYHFWDNDNGRVFNVGHPENTIAWKVKTAGDGVSKTVNYSVNDNPEQSINDDGNTKVATLTLGTSGINGNYPNGMSYTIVPEHNGSITLTAKGEVNKEMLIREYADEKKGDVRNDVLIYRSGVLSSEKAKNITYTFDVRKGRHYKIYSHESSQLNVSNISYTYYPNGGDEYFIPEFDGLGFFPVKYWDEKDKNVQLSSDDKGIMLSGDKTYQLIVPNVKLGETVYLAVSDDKEGSIAVGTPEAKIERAKDRSKLVNMTGNIKNADFEDEITKEKNWEWTRSGGNGPALGNGINGKSCEFWNETAANLSFSIKQTLSSLPAGKYELRAKAANLRDGATLTDGTGRAVLYAKINGNEEKATVDISDEAWGVLAAKTYSVSFTLNATSDVEIGFKTEGGAMAARWFVCDDFELWYYGTDNTQLRDRIGYVYKDAEDYEAKGHYDTKELSIYEIEGEKRAGEDVLIYLKNVNLHKVAVSVDNKNVSAAGYATEAREYPLDFTLANLFLGREQIAYQVTGVKNTDREKPNVDISEVRYIPRTEDKDPAKNNGVMITGDYINRTSATTWPLFTTDVDRKMSNMERNRLVGVVNSDNIDYVTQRTKRTDVANDYWYNYLLSLAGYVVKYGDNDTVDGDGYHNTKGEAIEEVKGLGFYLVMEEGTKLPGNQGNYTKGKPQNHSAYLQLEERLAKQNEFNQSGNYPAGARQVFFIDVDSILTGIDEVLIDDDELPATEENNSANILKNGVFYTLQGVPVKNPTKGIYIFNGKKVYVK